MLKESVAVAIERWTKFDTSSGFTIAKSVPSVIIRLYRTGGRIMRNGCPAVALTLMVATSSGADAETLFMENLRARGRNGSRQMGHVAL